MGLLVKPGQETPQDWGKLAAYLETQGIALSKEMPPQQFSSGFGNLNYLIDIKGDKFVLRRPPLGPIPRGANDMNRENRILSRLWKRYPLAPEALHFCADTDILGAPFFLMKYRAGIVIGATLPDRLTGWCDSSGKTVGAHISAVMIDSLVALHNVDPAKVGLETLGRPDGFIARTTKGWMQRLETSWHGPLPKIAHEVEHWLIRHQPEDAKPTLIHNDFKLDNMIFNPDTLAPVAVIDWDMGTRGAPAYDLAVLLSYWTQADDPQVMQDLGQMPTASHGFVTRQEAAARYAETSGHPLDHFAFFRVLATLRLAGVFMQLNNRYRQGGTTDGRLESFDRLALGLLEFARDIAKGKTF